ncbi:MAG: hypothetical protein ACT4PV_10130 [Planctomycetaceae bacterium]
MSLLARLRVLRPPPVASIVAVLAAGLLGGFMVNADQRPSEFTRALARDRLARFHGGTHPVAPSGTILGDRPAFEWQGVPGAATYTLTLVTPEGKVWRSADTTRDTFYLLKPPSRIEEGQSLRFVVRALDAQARLLGSEQAAEFRRIAMDEELTATVQAARGTLRGAELHFIMAGIYASQDSPDDVASELRAYLEGAPGGADAALAREVLARLGRAVGGA